MQELFFASGKITPFLFIFMRFVFSDIHFAHTLYLYNNIIV